MGFGLRTGACKVPSRQARRPDGATDWTPALWALLFPSLLLARRLDGASARSSIQKHRNCTVAALSGQHTRFDGTLQALSEAQKRSQRNGLLPAAAMVQLSPLLGAARSSDGATQSIARSCSQSSGKRSSMTTGLPFSKKQWVVMPLQTSLPSTFIS